VLDAHKTSQIPSKTALGGARLGQGAEPKNSYTPPANKFLNDFLIIFEVAFFNVKIEARAKNIVNTVKK